MNRLFSEAELSRLIQPFFTTRLTYYQGRLRFVTQTNARSHATFFQQLHHRVLPQEFTALHQPPIKATLSLWQQDWLSCFLPYWVWLLHRHHLHMVLSEQGTSLVLGQHGEVARVLVNLSYTPVHEIRHEAAQLTAYRQLKQFLAPIFQRLSDYSGLNIAVFWHNCANLIEFLLKSLEQEQIEIGRIYRQLFLDKKWDDYEWSPFYNTVEYLDFPALPLPQPVRLRKVCCHAYLDTRYDCCTNCPKLKKMDEAELAMFVQKWGGAAE